MNFVHSYVYLQIVKKCIANSYLTIDVEAPKIHCPDSVELPTATGTSSALYDYDTPVVTDNSGETITPVSTDVPSNKKFPIGSNVYLYHAEDSSGNQGFCSFSVNVIGLCYLMLVGCYLFKVNHT